MMLSLMLLTLAAPPSETEIVFATRVLPVLQSKCVN